MSIRIGVVLSGCGVFDGSEIHEAVSVLIALAKNGAAVRCFAPDIPQLQTVNHLTQQADSSTRNVLIESARIARGKVEPLAGANVSDLDALVFPGGFGAAKNLCDFAVKGPECTVQSDVAKIITAMHAAKKPMGFACIAPVLAARVLGKLNLKPQLTIGTDPGTAAAIGKMGGVHQAVGETDICVDEANRIVSTPCYMNDVSPWVVYQGAEKMVVQVLKMVKN